MFYTKILHWARETLYVRSRAAIFLQRRQQCCVALFLYHHSAGWLCIFDSRNVRLMVPLLDSEELTVQVMTAWAPVKDLDLKLHLQIDIIVREDFHTFTSI